MERTVVIIGGGYGGTLVAKELDADANVILIDPRKASSTRPRRCGH